MEFGNTTIRFVILLESFSILATTLLYTLPVSAQTRPCGRRHRLSREARFICLSYQELSLTRLAR